MTDASPADTETTDWPFLPYVMSVLFCSALLQSAVLGVVARAYGLRGEEAAGLFMWGLLSAPAMIVLGGFSALTYSRYQAIRSLRSRILFFALVVGLTTGLSLASPLLAT